MNDVLKGISIHLINFHSIDWCKKRDLIFDTNIIDDSYILPGLIMLYLQLSSSSIHSHHTIDDIYNHTSMLLYSRFHSTQV